MTFPIGNKITLTIVDTTRKLMQETTAHLEIEDVVANVSTKEI
jgi:hypothetical protein